jgi:putative transcriptional regulator
MIKPRLATVAMGADMTVGEGCGVDGKYMFSLWHGIAAVAGPRGAHGSRAVRILLLIILVGMLVPDSSHGLPAPPSEKIPLSAGVFLVAKPGMRDPRFHHAVILITVHNSRGTIGLMINHPTRVTLQEALPQLDELKDRDDVLFIGGPVDPESLFTLVRSPHPPTHAQHIAKQLYFTAGARGLLDILSATGPQVSLRSYVGYCGWAPGQLRYEIGRGDWLVVRDADSAVFDKDPASVWQDLIKAHGGEWI